MTDWCVYLLACRDGSFYCGATNDVQKRVAKHNSGKGAKYTKTRRPVTLLEVSKPLSKSGALKLERLVKKQRKYNKVQCIRDHPFWCTRDQW